MIGKLFDRFIEWTLNRQEQHLMKKPKPKKRVSRVRRRANAKKK
jgi:hypothetical protein